MNKLALGSAQFGLNYGINNRGGMIPREEVFAILDEAVKFGIDTVDTAAISYGESESIIGDYIFDQNRELKVISKLPQVDPEGVRGVVEQSLRNLRVNEIYGYLIRGYDYHHENPSGWDILKRLKQEGKIRKIGFTLYDPEEYEAIIRDRLDVDIVQVPYSIFDQRFSDYYEEMESLNIEIHVRSVFLQGLAFMAPNDLGGRFLKIKEKIERLRMLSKNLDVPISNLCINFVSLEECISKIVVGVDSIDNIKGILGAKKHVDAVRSHRQELSLLREDDEEIIIPSNWSTERS